MTVALGIRCDEGNLLLADRQITKAGGLKYYEKKIREVDGEAPKGFFNISFAYAGFPEAAKFVRADTEKRILRLGRDEISLDSMQECVEQALEQWWKKHKRKGDLELLVSLFVWGCGSRLLRSKGNLVVDAEFECLGWGDSSLIRYFMETFVTGRMGLHQLLPLCVYMMEQATKYIDGCGGKIDVLCAAHDRMILRPSASYIQKDNEEAERHFRRMFEIFHDPGRSDADLIKNLDFLRSRALALRGKLESRVALRHIREERP